MFHKINHVSALDGFRLCIQFADGVTKVYDMAPLAKEIPCFQILAENQMLFGCVEVDVGGHGVVWDDDLDLSCDELWENGVRVETPFDGLLSFSDATRIWGLNESTLRKAIAYGKLKGGLDACKFGKQWVVSYDAMRREYGAPPCHPAATNN